jgi:hypothetical protein
MPLLGSAATQLLRFLRGDGAGIDGPHPFDCSAIVFERMRPIRCAPGAAAGMTSIV